MQSGTSVGSSRYQIFRNYSLKAVRRQRGLNDFCFNSLKPKHILHVEKAGLFVLQEFGGA